MRRLIIKFKSEVLNLKDNKVTYTKDNGEILKLSPGNESIDIHLNSMEDFPEIIGYFNLDEIESISFK